jgi:hypothetical protein
VRRPAHGEEPLYWVGSSKRDLQAFPETVKDAIGSALSIAQFGGNTQRRSRGGVTAPAYSRLWKITTETRIAPSRTRAVRHRNRMWTSFQSV